MRSFQLRKPIEIIDRTLTVDPGWHTGWAYWEEPDWAYWQESDNLLEVSRKWLQKYGVLNIKKVKHGPMSRFNYMWVRFESLLKMNPQRVYIEGTAIWGNSLKSMTAAKRGDIMTLSYLIGGYMHACTTKSIDCIIISANDWKGQSTDEVIARKCDDLFQIGLNQCTQHTLDAIGMGMSGFGLLERKQVYTRGKR